MKHEWQVVISAEHPSLPGHFPGHPVVPGVLILEEILVGLRKLDPEMVVTGLPAVKLSSPLKPGEALTIHVEIDSHRDVEFRCLVGTRGIASGTIQVRRRTAGRTGSA